MKKVFVFGVVLLGLFLIAGCAAQQPTEEEKAQLEQLSDEELLEVATAEDQAGVAGQATKNRAQFKGFKAAAKEELKGRLSGEIAPVVNILNQNGLSVTCPDGSRLDLPDVAGGEPIDPKATSCQKCRLCEGGGTGPTDPRQCIWTCC